MLVLSRKEGECVDIDGGSENGGITVMVVRDHKNRVRLGFKCDPTRPVHRREVRLAIEREEKDT